MIECLPLCDLTHIEPDLQYVTAVRQAGLHGQKQMLWIQPTAFKSVTFGFQSTLNSTPQTYLSEAKHENRATAVAFR